MRRYESVNTDALMELLAKYDIKLNYKTIIQ